MKSHSNYITHINNEEDVIYLRTKHFPVNMRLFNTSLEYREIILNCCIYIEKLCLLDKQGYKKPHGMSSANAGLSFNIIGITKSRNTNREYCRIMINPTILEFIGEPIDALSNCGSIILDNPITIKRYPKVRVTYYSEYGQFIEEVLDKANGSFTVQHEIDHNNGILITDYPHEINF